VKYFRKDIIKVQVVGYLYIHRLLHGKMKIKKIEITVEGYSKMQEYSYKPTLHFLEYLEI